MCSSVAVDGSLVVVVSPCPITITVALKLASLFTPSHHHLLDSDEWTRRRGAAANNFSHHLKTYSCAKATSPLHP
jgi:hypothetical protein